MKIGFIYYSFYPVSGGASVHGFNLARELHNLGYELYKLNGDPDPYTRKMKNPLTGLFWILKNCDLIYIRMDYFLNLRNLISLFALTAGKKIVVEINSPSDELHLFGKSRKYIRYADRIMAKVLKRTDAVITVSDPLKKYCTEALNLKHVHVIENGGEIFDGSDDSVSQTVRKTVENIRKNYSKIIVWAGSANEMQDLSYLQKIAGSHKNSSAVILIVKEDPENGVFPQANKNVFIFRDLSRSDVKYIISHSDIGLALYSDYPWSRWGFYNSSLKMYEFLNNGLLTITNKEGTATQRSYPNFQLAYHPDEFDRLIEEYEVQEYGHCNHRTWRDVAEETSEIIQKVVSR